MVTVEFQDDALLVVRFSGETSATDIEWAWRSLADARFTCEHDVIVDARGARIGFPVHEIPGIISRRDAAAQHANGITCFIVDSHLVRAAITVVQNTLTRRARWHLVSDFDEALACIAERRAES